MPTPSSVTTRRCSRAARASSSRSSSRRASSGPLTTRRRACGCSGGRVLRAVEASLGHLQDDVAARSRFSSVMSQTVPSGSHPSMGRGRSSGSSMNQSEPARSGASPSTHPTICPRWGRSDATGCTPSLFHGLPVARRACRYRKSLGAVRSPRRLVGWTWRAAQHRPGGKSPPQATSATPLLLTANPSVGCRHSRKTRARAPLRPAH